MNRLKELTDKYVKGLFKEPLNPHLKNVDSPESKPRNWKPKKNRMKRILKAISNTVSGENKVGEALHGVLDLFPFPNQVIAKAVKYVTSGEPDQAQAELKKLISFRNIVALIAFALLVFGVITIEDLRSIIDAVSNL